MSDINVGDMVEVQKELHIRISSDSELGIPTGTLGRVVKEMDLEDPTRFVVPDRYGEY